jgi:MoaA/NifB/PqqE/SkfB family radical SAM enzyme
MNLHIELTNRCVLECPGCARTQWRDLVKKPVSKTDLDGIDLERFLDCDEGRKINKFLLCGDYGDAIYYPDLFDFLARFRDSKKFEIRTNGSYRDKNFWHRLSAALTTEDVITFSIDGLKDTNMIYRINSDWDSIMLGIDIMARGPARVRWKTIVFRHNYLQLSEIKKLAEDKGCEFSAEKTHRFGRDGLEPPDDLIETNHLFREQYMSDHTIEIVPGCMDEKTVGCDGILYPCDWIRNPRTLYKSPLWKQRERWLQRLSIKHTDYDSALRVVQEWADWVRESSLEQRATVDILCKMKCRKGCRQNKYLEI